MESVQFLLHYCPPSVTFGEATVSVVFVGFFLRLPIEVTAALVRCSRNTAAANPPMFVATVPVCFHTDFTDESACIRERLSWVSRHALPLVSRLARAISVKACGYRRLLSTLEPLLFPKGRSVMKTSTLLFLNGSLETSHLNMSTESLLLFGDRFALTAAIFLAARGAANSWLSPHMC